MLSMEPVLKRGFASWERDVLTDDEYALRVAAVREALRSNGLDALVVVNYSLLGVMVDYADMAYLSGLQSGGLLLVPLAAEPVYIGFGGGRELAFVRSLTWLSDVTAGGKQAFEVLRNELGGRGVGRGAVGVVGTADLPPTVEARLREALEDFDVRPFDAEMRALRAAKRPRELLATAITLAIAEDAVAAGVAAFAAGADNSAAMLEAERVARARKARDVRILASMGGPELRPWEGRLGGRHAPLRLWLAAQYQGYWAEASAVTPAPNDSAANRAVAAMIDVARAGSTTGEVAAAATASLTDEAAAAALEYGLGGAVGLAHEEGLAIRPGGGEHLIEGGLLALRAHVATGAAPSLASAIVRVGQTGATPLAPLKISG